VTEKFEFIDAEYAVYQESDDVHVPSIVKMCRWMGVSRSGFYEWRSAPESATAKRRGILALVVRKSFGESDGTYGYRRVHADLAAWGVPAPALRALIDSHRHDAASAGTLTRLADDIAALRTAIEAVAARVRHHEEQIRQLNRKKQYNSPDASAATAN
jgi:hypothetical protein